MDFKYKRSLLIKLNNLLVHALKWNVCNKTNFMFRKATQLPIFEHFITMEIKSNIR